MKTLKRNLQILLLLLPSLLMAMEKEIPFTFDDRDRIIRTEQNLEALDPMIDGLEKKIDSRF